MKSVTEEERKTKLFGEFVNKLPSLLPVIVSLLGKGLGVEASVAPSLASDLARGAFFNMSDAAFENLRTVLTPEQFAAVTELRRLATQTNASPATSVGAPAPPASPAGAPPGAPAVVPWPPQLLLHAFLVLREGLLPYVARQLAAGQKVVLPGDHGMQVEVLRRLMAAMSPSMYAEFVTQPGMMDESERVAFDVAVKELGLKPGAPEPPSEPTPSPDKKSSP
jgi:hypothetical protein